MAGNNDNKSFNSCLHVSGLDGLGHLLKNTMKGES